MDSPHSRFSPAYQCSRSRSRSKSPYSHTYDGRPRQHSRFPHGNHHRSQYRAKHSKSSEALPLGARTISKHDLEKYKSLLGLYLDIQKGLVFEDLDEREVKGRWRSFVGKWNRGELAEGWYDTATLDKANGEGKGDSGRTRRISEESERKRSRLRGNGDEDSSEDEEDGFGPVLPTRQEGGASRDESGYKRSGHGQRSGPAIPSIEDLQVRKESLFEDRAHSIEDLRFDRKIDRKRQRDVLDELAPRAEAGTRERQLEKKKEKAESNRSFARAKGSPGAVEEVGEVDLMGADEGIEGFKRVRREVDRKKNEREVRKEEVLRARMAEREERAKEFRVREERTMKGLKALAKERFG